MNMANWEAHCNAAQAADAAEAVQEAVLESMMLSKIVTIKDWGGLQDALLAQCDDSVETDGLIEYWGSDDAGATWRVHLQLSA